MTIALQSIYKSWDLDFIGKDLQLINQSIDFSDYILRGGYLKIDNDYQYIKNRITK